MSNPYRCELELVAGAERYVLAFDWNAAAEFETVSRKTLSEALVEAADGRISAVSIRALLWAGLRRNHPRMTLSDVGKLLDVLGYRDALKAVHQALDYFFPEQKSAPEEDPDAGPPTPAVPA